MKLLTTPSQRAEIIASSCLRDMVSRHNQTCLARDCNALQAMVDRMRTLLDEAPCTCENPYPHDWPHDPKNEMCYKTRVTAALRRETTPA